MTSSIFNLPDRSVSGSGSYFEISLQNEALNNTLRVERAAFVRREQELLDEIEKLKTDHEHCVDDFQALDDYTKGLQKGMKEAKITIDKLKNQLAETNRCAEADEAAQEEAKEASIAIDELTEKLEEANRRAEAGEAAQEEMREAMINVTKSNQELEAEKETSKAMIQITLQTRLRFLLQAARSVVQEALPQLPQRNIINEFIKSGNSAAHAGHGDTDAQLLLLRGLYPANLYPGLVIVFKGLYRMTPIEFIALSEKEKVAIDCEVTIRTLQVQNTSMARPIQQRQQALDHIEIIRTKASKMERDEFESDGDTTRRLGLIKGLTAEIIDGDRRYSDDLIGGGSPRPVGGRRRSDRRNSSFGGAYGGGSSGFNV